MNPSGICQCGCGLPAPKIVHTDVKRGYVRGEHHRFRRYHHLKGEHHPRWKGESAGYSCRHDYIQRNWPKTGKCDECGSDALTNYANLSGEHRRTRSDYRELCIPCHKALDKGRQLHGRYHWSPEIHRV